MTTLANRHATALVVIDVQRDVVANAYKRDAVITNINELVARARDAKTPVIWVQHGDDELPANSDGWQLAPELMPHAGEPTVHKTHRDSFEATTLERELAARGVGRLIVTGAQTDFCVRWTLHSALSRGYDTVLVSDAHTTDDLSEHGLPTAQDLITHTNMFWQDQGVPDRATDVVTTADITFNL